MVEVSQVGGGVLGFLTGLAQAIEQRRQQQRQEALTLLQVLGQQPGRQIAPANVRDLVPTTPLTRLFGGNPFVSQSGAPVITLGGTPLTVESLPTLSPGDIRSAIGSPSTPQPLLGQSAITGQVQPVPSLTPSTGQPSPQTPIVGGLTDEDISQLEREFAGAPRTPSTRQAIAQRAQQLRQQRQAQTVQQERLRISQEGLRIRQQSLQATQAERQRERQRPDFGLGDRMDTAIMSLFGEELRQPDGSFAQPDAEMIRQARLQVQEEQLRLSRERGLIGAERQAEVTRQRLAAQQQFQESQTLSQATGDASRQFFNPNTGERIVGGRLFREVRQAELAGTAVRLSLPETKEINALNRVNPLLQEIRESLAIIYGPGGIFENLPPGIIRRLVAGGRGAVQRRTQLSPELVDAVREIEANVDLIRRNLQGQVGAQTDRDAERGLASLPKLTGFLPDSQEAAFRTFNTLLTIVNGAAGAIFDRPGFTFQGLEPLVAETPTAGVTQGPLEIISIQQVE